MADQEDQHWIVESNVEFSPAPPYPEPIRSSSDWERDQEALRFFKFHYFSVCDVSEYQTIPQSFLNSTGFDPELVMLRSDLRHCLRRRLIEEALEHIQPNLGSAARNISPAFLPEIRGLVRDIPQLRLVPSVMHYLRSPVVFNPPRHRETFHANSASAAQLDPESEWHPSYPDGVFNQRAPSLHGTNDIIINIPGNFSSVSSEDADNLFLNRARVDGRQLSDQPWLKETLLAISAQAGLAMVTSRTGANTSLSQHEKIQFFIAAAVNVIGFLALFFAILLRKKKTTLARKLAAIGIALAAFGYLALMGMLLNDNIMLWVTGLACLVCFPALAFA